MLETQTTVTTETMKVDEINFTVRTFEQKVTGFCDVCGEQETGNEQGLINAGWQLNSRFQLCPTCNL
jgi:hypothetical protein